MEYTIARAVKRKTLTEKLLGKSSHTKGYEEERTNSQRHTAETHKFRNSIFSQLKYN